MNFVRKTSAPSPLAQCTLPDTPPLHRKPYWSQRGSGIFCANEKSSGREAPWSLSSEWEALGLMRRANEEELRKVERMPTGGSARGGRAQACWGFGVGWGECDKGGGCRKERRAL